MFELKEKLDIKIVMTLLFSVFILTGLSVTQVYGQPLDSPLYNHTKTKEVESMNAPANTNSDTNANGVSPMTGGPSLCHSQGTKGCGVEAVPVMSVAGEIVFILTLTSGACWAILRKKRP